MSIDYDQLKIDDAAGHPITGAFNVDAALAAGEWNALNVSGPAAIQNWVKYILENRSKLAAETNPTPIVGRIHEVANTAIAANTSWGETVTKEMVHAACMFIVMFETPSIETVDFSGTEFDDAYTLLGPPAGGGAGCMKDPDIAALKAISDNRQSYATAKGYPRLRTADIEKARALP